MTVARISIGTSSCLLGERVRYDGGHKRDDYIADVLSEYFEYVPFCPEAAIGLGVPRAAIRLTATLRGIRAVQPDAGGRDVTDDLAANGREIARTNADLSGYIFKARSPSCGTGGVSVYDSTGKPTGTTGGVYTQAFREIHPLLPAEEEGRLADPDLRDNFLERVFVYHRWQQASAGGISSAGLQRFHAAYRYLVPAHGGEAAEELDRLASGEGGACATTAGLYIEKLMSVLSCPVRRSQQAAVLQRAASERREALDAIRQRELAEAIDGYRRGAVPIIVPLNLIHA